MRRYLTDEPLAQDTDVTLKGDTFHHIHVVCRLGVGDVFELLNAHQSQAFLVKVQMVGKSEMVVRVLETRALPLLKPPYVHLVLNYPKPKVFDAVLEKAVELGVAKIWPVLSDYSFFRTADKLKGKEGRWEKIVRSAMQQSGRFQPLEMAPVQPLERFLAEQKSSLFAEDSLALAFYEGEAPLLSEFFNTQPLSASIQNIWVFVGSEGGFSFAEIDRFKSLQIPSVSLGDQVLRVETACVSIVSVLRYMSGAV